MNPINELRFAVSDRINDVEVGPKHVPLALLGEFQYFDHADDNREFLADSSGPACPQVYIPNLSVKDVVLKKSVFATEADAKAWVESHGYRSDGLTEEPEQWRYRQEAGACP